MKQGIDDPRGMAAGAKEYIFHFIATLKLTEKERAVLEADREKWRKREELALSKGAEDLALEARRETERIQGKIDSLFAEETELKAQIEAMRKQLPGFAGLAARERTIDPDLLEQELNIALGKDLAGDNPAGPGLEQKFESMDTDMALEALKARMRAGAAPDNGAAGGTAGNGGSNADGGASTDGGRET
jgi:phage shock protein A